jgi:predicted TIM-barrel fold metal-dependent hydrolase
MSQPTPRFAPQVLTTSGAAATTAAFPALLALALAFCRPPCRALAAATAAAATLPALRCLAVARPAHRLIAAKIAVASLPALCALAVASGVLAPVAAAAGPRQAGSPPSTEAAGGGEPVMGIEEYEPRSTLVVPEHPVARARYPFVDVHSHHDGAGMSAAEVDRLVADMDALNLAVLVNLSGGTGERLAATVAHMEGRHPERFVVFANVDFGAFGGVDDPEFGRRAAARLAEDVAAGARGLKIFKNLGLTLTDGAGRRIATDDPRFDPIWAKCAELGIPVLIHTGEPSPFFEPWDRYNERWLELKQRPGRARPPDRFPPWEQVMGEQWNLFRRHPETTFIAAHLAWLGGDLGRLGRLLDELPNVYTEIGAVLAELGRQPRFAREWFIRYQDRVLFGKDSWAPEEYPVYFRTLETADEYFDYYRKRHAHWKMYGLDLPDEVLRKLYYGNALRLLPGLDRSLFPPAAAGAAAP